MRDNGSGVAGGGLQTNVSLSYFTNSIVGSQGSGGARLENRYINRTLTNEPLWPWPMDERAESELGINITDLMAPHID